MLHLRKIIFASFDEGLSNEAVLLRLREQQNVELTLPRIQNYRDIYNDPKRDREKFIAGQGTLG